MTNIRKDKLTGIRSCYTPEHAKTVLEKQKAQALAWEQRMGMKPVTDEYGIKYFPDQFISRKGNTISRKKTLEKADRKRNIKARLNPAAPLHVPTTGAGNARKHLDLAKPKIHAKPVAPKTAGIDAGYMVNTMPENIRAENKAITRVAETQEKALFKDPKTQKGYMKRKFLIHT